MRLVPFNQIQTAISTLEGGDERTYGRKNEEKCTMSGRYLTMKEGHLKVKEGGGGKTISRGKCPF